MQGESITLRGEGYGEGNRLEHLMNEWLWLAVGRTSRNRMTIGRDDPKRLA